MNRHLMLLVLMIVVLFALVGCSGAVATVPAPLPTTAVQETMPPVAVQPTIPATAAATAAVVATKPPAAVTSGVTPTVLRTGTPLPKGALTCPSVTALAASAQLAARVNGQGVSLDTYNRQASQAQAAMVANGLDPKSTAGQESLKSLKLQVLDQMINDIVIAQQADREGIKLTDDDLNARLAQMIQDAGTVDKLNEYMTKNQLTLGDLCSQVRASLLGEVMLNRITSALPTNVEQVHVRQMLVSTADLGATLRDRARKGEDFAALAKQYSQDETSKANGGDLGWVPKGVLDPRIDAVIFQIAVNQVSDVVKTDFGYHVVQVTEKDKARALPPELIQDARQKAFLAWLQAVRETMKIERLVQP